MEKQPITYEDLKQIRDMFAAIDLQSARIQKDNLEDLLTEVLHLKLGRDPVKDDAKDVTIFTRGGMGDPNMYLTYKDKMIGVIKHRMSIGLEGGSFQFIFEPC